MRSFVGPTEQMPPEHSDRAPLATLRAVCRVVLLSLALASAFNLLGCCNEGSASQPAGAAAAPSVGGAGYVSPATGAEEKLIPYNDILRYPSDWPDISQRRSNAN